MKFIELHENVYNRGGYIPNEMYVAVNDIARVERCIDDYRYASMKTKDGKIHILQESYEDVVKKIKEASDQKEGD